MFTLVVMLLLPAMLVSEQQMATLPPLLIKQRRQGRFGILISANHVKQRNLLCDSAKWVMDVFRYPSLVVRFT